ncbi:WD40 repeat-like protein [Hypomontagnella monticulosa]|nr:WD40 repeat-like protein [Hypomontagnella monticulosa]
MRLRQSNQAKRFDSILFADLSDGEREDSSARQERELSDDEFVVDAHQAQNDQNDQDIDIHDLSDLESGDGKQADTQRKKNRRSWAPNPVNSFAQVQPYPTDPSQKWTRTYVGPVKRWTRLEYLVDYWFGDEENRKDIFNEFMSLWYDFELLPPKLLGPERLERARNSWMPNDFAKSLEDRFSRWYDRYLSSQHKPQSSVLIDKPKALHQFLPHAEGEMSVLLGHISSQKEYPINQGGCIPFSDSGVPIEDENDYELRSGGWLLDVGGIILSMGWAPINGQVSQLLAIVVIPYSDQAFYMDPNDAPKATDLKEGVIQIWKFEAEKDPRGVLRPARIAPKMIQVICSHWGRISRMHWCPVPFSNKHHITLLAILCGDGRLRIIEVRRNPEKDESGIFEELQDPMVTIEPPKEHTLEINCFAWLNMNRVAVAYSDGSVAVWSLSPCQQLQRHLIHSSPIMDIVSSYPSNPFIIATMPMGGVFTLTDLNRPTAEKTYHGNPLVSLQPNVLAWSDHLRGFASIWPTSFPGTSTISFVQSRVFPLSRHICTVEGQTTCLAMGICHPCLLVGSSDGSVWAINVLRKVASHREKTHKVKLFQHEYCPPERLGTTDEEEEQVSPRGACRILNGFLPQVNFHPLGTRIAKESRVKRARREKKKRTQKLEDDDFSDDPAELEEDDITMVPAPIVVHEPLTRITALSWNPNVEFSWWAAAAMGSGLVRVMDLGVENTRRATKKRSGSFDSAEQEPDEDHDSLVYEDEIEEGSDGDVDMAE